ncbi:LPS export ABC transporter periplasmic protein LptC [Porphyromonas crevioricanis]|uniref:Lipopolysaccharide-assembly, LptC-related n=2 Tax=Porphyromonas crevioricanis TaxID=393921 RepID=A0A2X4PPM8_9PORP|nr:LPS export ABC transporter periplasmic protein LptC [Porphyromonas crevioricanis]SJZ73757.1 LPS export ABC transporter protein LptC [Porphyromonas crevioricanis]SQH73478.1 Lipopolysaccharide-assembly, LptC-related [Porphyromonas crevioricanis]
MQYQRYSFKYKGTAPVLVTWAVLVASVLLPGCGGSKLEMSKQDLLLDTVYMMCTYDVHTLVSDSGLTQYKLDAKEWRIYDKGERPHWYFPQGIYFERFDSLKRPIAKVSSDTAYNYTSEELWELVGHVHIRNMSGVDFYAPRMFWDSRNARVYSPDSVYIKAPDRVLRGQSFEANQDLSSYSFVNSSAEVDYQEPEEDSKEKEEEKNPLEKP